MRLRIWLPPLAELRNDSQLSFETLDKDRRVQHRSTSSIGGLPKNVDCELVLHPTDVLLLEIRPPRLSGSKLARSLPSLVEERLVANVDEVHVVATPRAPDGTAVAAVIDRALLRRGLDLFARLNRRVLAAVPNPFALSFDAHRWRARIRDGAGSVRTGPTSGAAFVSHYDAPVELQLLIKQAIAPPKLVEVDGDCDADTWSEVLGTAVKQVGPESEAPPVLLNLLQYQFAPGFADWKGWRVPAVLGIICVLVMLTGLNLHAWKLRAEETALRARMAAIVRDVIPGVPAVLDPLAQMQQRVDQLRNRAGIDSAGFLSVAYDLGNIVDADSVKSMQFRDKVLNVEFVSGISDTEAERQEIVSRASDVGLDIRFTGSRATVRRRGGA